ncbi:RNA-binding protein 44 isoform X2 [Centropristis striata]|uniref:RNA-binding protein 44 isoform X2 n=1 Tax=Centropristis striata TaxID=184440 RepID=UPI0027DF1008|nr:RNA-binding protein 44 isoform X2 [Centropristis striata]
MTSDLAATDVTPFREITPCFFQTLWPVYPISLPYGVAVSRPPYAGSEYAGVVVPSWVTPRFYDRVLEEQKEKRIFFLDISLFELVDAHKYLSLTDPKLLGWYLSLGPDDRKIIQDEGGFNQFLQRHPALELSQHHVYVKCSAMYASNVSQTLTRLGRSNSTDGSQNHPCEEICRTKHQVHLQACSRPGTQEPDHPKELTGLPPSALNGRRQPVSSSSAAGCRDPAGLANLSLELDLERYRRGGEPELRKQRAATHSHSADGTYSEGSPSQSEWESIEKDLSPDYFSFDGDKEYSDRSIVQTAASQQVASLLEEKPTKEGCQDPTVSSVDEDGDHFHSIMEDDDGILVCLTSDDVKTCHSGVSSHPVTSDPGAPAAGSETLKCVMKRSTAERSTSPIRAVTGCEVGVGTEPPPLLSAVTQTEDPPTADKHVITEVHMADLDYLTVEFMKLKLAQEQLREQKEKRLGCKLRKECECLQRAQQAELSLLALQYSMCRQHCWKLYCTSAEGGQLHHMIKNPPANIVRLLQKLDDDFNQMRDQIVAGVPLERLKPLSVDYEERTTGERYIPAQIVGGVLGNVPSCVQETQKQPSGGENGNPDDESTSDSELSQRREKPIKTEESRVRRAATLVPQDRDKQEKTVCKELSTCEAWYDAEEELQPAAAETRETGNAKDKNNNTESVSEEVSSSVLWVSNLPGHVRESDVMLWFEKYQPSKVSIAALKNDLSVAIVIVSGAQSAEAAARALNGCSMQGRTLHVEHINRASGGSRSQDQDTSTPQTSRPEASSSERTPVPQPPLGSGTRSTRSRKVVSISPTAKGTCVPQHYGTMGSFDTLMAELTQRHPEAGRQRIVDALIQLKAEHQGVLSGLPLRTIRDMASQLLTRPQDAT